MPSLRKILSVIIVLAVGFFILLPNLDFQFYLAQGDHGRDLYSFKKTFEGAVPYKDYSSLNGPLMPYYYSLFYHIFGVSIQSTLIGYYLIILLTGLLVFCAARLYLDSFPAFICALWYWAFRGLGFYYTYNHCGALFLMILVIYCLLAYIRTPGKKHIIAGLIALFLLLLIRPNIGAAAAAAFIVSMGLIIAQQNIIQKAGKFLKVILCCLGVLFLSFFIYKFLTIGQPRHITEDFSYYLQAVDLKQIPNNISSLLQLLSMLLFSTWTNRVVSALLLILFARAILSLNKLLPERTERGDFLSAIGIFLIFISAASLEYIVSVHLFRIGWFLPIIVLLIFFIIFLGLKNSPKLLRLSAYTVLLFVAVLSLGRDYLFTLANKRPETRLNIPPNQVYVAKQHQQWLETIVPAVGFIKQNVPQNDKILAIPYAPLYYFLSGRDSGSRTLLFLQLLREEKELEILKEIDDNNVNFIIISNRAFRDVEKRFGSFGKDYGGLLAEHIFENFEEVAAFGPWEKQAHWIINHAVKIYRRK